VEQAAQLAGLGRTTAYRRLATPAFQRALAAAERRMLTHAVAMLADGTRAAVATLRVLSTSAQQGPVRLAAPRRVLDFACRGLEHLQALQLDERLTRLEDVRTDRAWRA